MRAGYGKSLRNFFISKNPIMLIDLGPGIFKQATVDTNILLIEKSGNDKQLKAVTLKKTNGAAPDVAGYFKDNAVDLNNLSEESWFIGNDAEQKLKGKIEKIGKPLKDWDVKIYRGVLTGLNEAFIIDTATKEKLCKEDPKNAEIIKPILRGRDIKRYSYEWAGLWLIATFPVLNINIEKYPSVKKHLLSYGKEKLEQSGTKLADGSISRKKTGNKWFETQDQIGYYGEFKKEKIVWSDIATEPIFTILPKDVYFNNTVYMVISENNKYLTAVLNSSIIKWYFPMIATDLGEHGQRFFKIFVEIMPVPEISSKYKPIVSEIESLVSTIVLKKEKKQNTLTEEKQIDKLVYKLYELTDEEIKIVEGG